jgi:hypothetical protein
MAATFPTLSSRAVIDVDRFEEALAFNPAIEAKAEDGLILIRQRTARVPRTWKFAYTWLTPEDKAALKALEDDTRVGADSFEWRNPVDSINRNVRLLAPIRFSLMGSRLAWRAEMSLEEV